jgi:predicted alpha/beta-fold hydrolase
VEKPPLRVERWDTPDDDFIDVHFLEGDPAMPTAVLLHGLEGCIESTYFMAMLRELHRAGWNAAAMEFRSCRGEMNRARRMYHSGETEDVGFVVQRLIERRPDIELYVAGYSLGGNVTAKWFGECGDALPANVRAGAAISAPYDLVASGKHMDSTVSRLYVLHFLRKLVPKAEEKHQQYPGVIDIERIRGARTFKEFDDHATAPLHGFADAHDYYTRVACGRYLEGVRRPLLLLSAEDDPFNPGHTLPRELAARHPYLHAEFTRFGGHCGFVQRGADGVESWAEAQVVRFFEAYRTSLT